MKTQKYGWIYLDKNSKLYHLTGKQAGARLRDRSLNDNPIVGIKRKYVRFAKRFSEMSNRRSSRSSRTSKTSTSSSGDKYM